MIGPCLFDHYSINLRPWAKYQMFEVASGQNATQPVSMSAYLDNFQVLREKLFLTKVHLSNFQVLADKHTIWESLQHSSVFG